MRARLFTAADGLLGIVEMAEGKSAVDVMRAAQQNRLFCVHLDEKTATPAVAGSPAADTTLAGAEVPSDRGPGTKRKGAPAT